MRPLTDRQKELLELLRKFIRENGYPPTRPECAAAMDVHPSTIDWHLTALMKKGWIEMQASSRAIRLMREDLPVVPAGRIAAGEPILAEGRIVDRMAREVAERFRPPPSYFLEVYGDSLDRLGLSSGDLVAVHATPEPENGQVVVARIDDEVTLKRLRRLDERHVELSPESTNPRHRPRVVDLAETELHIDGVMVGALIGTKANSRDHQ